MLNWRVCRVREYCSYDHVKRRRRRDCRRKWHGTVIMISAALIALCFMPAWVIALLACMVVMGIAVIWFLG